jgi:hypothetical protein
MSTWQGDWLNRIKERVKELGYNSIFEFIDTYPAESYSDLAKMLSVDKDVAPVQVAKMHALASLERCKKGAIIDSFCRRINEDLPNGWGIGKYWESRLMGSLSMWEGMWDELANLENFDEILFEISPTQGWKPNKDDPLVQDIFKHIFKDSEGM